LSFHKLRLTPASTLVMSRTLMPARGRLDASALDAAVASCRTWPGRVRLDRKADRLVWKAQLERLNNMFVILG
jgi:hypothetical protein